MKPSIRVDGRSTTCHQLLSRRSRRPHAEGTGTQLSDAQQRSRTSHEPSEGDLSQLRYSLCRQASLCSGSSCGVAREDHRGGRVSPGGIFFPTTRNPWGVAPSEEEISP